MFSDTYVQLDVILQNIEDGQPPGFIANLIEYKQTIVREFTVPVYAVACIGIVQTFIDRWVAATVLSFSRVNVCVTVRLLVYAVITSYMMLL